MSPLRATNPKQTQTMPTTFIATFHKTTSARKLSALRKQIKAIDSSMDLCEINQPGNSIRLYIERPNDGTNQNLDQRVLNQRAAELVSTALG